MTASAIQPAQTMPLVPAADFSAEQIDLIKQTVAAGTSDLELALFLEVAKSSGLNPFQRQIYAVMRWDAKTRKEKMVIQTGIDGYRLIAARSGAHMGTTDPEFGPITKEGFPEFARVIVRKLVHGQLAEFPATARWSEYVQTGKEGPAAMWKRMPHTMLGKCFDERTEVLTTHGFQRFSEVTGRVMQITERGVESTDAQPFMQDWRGDMVTLESDDLNFCVTPNHDMVTTAGKIEAGAMYEQARTRPKFHIPRSVQGTRPDTDPLSDRAIMTAAAYVADGSDIAGGFQIAVSRPLKVAFLRTLLAHDVERKRPTAGDVAVLSSGREVTTQADKQVFIYANEAAGGLIGRGKVINLPEILELSQRQIRLFIDTWLKFDGHTQVKSGVRRIYTSRLDHIEAFEVLAVAAGYAVSPRRSRVVEGTERPNFYMTISDRDAIPVIRWGEGSHRTGLELTRNTSGKVWCVTVPSGVIVVRRHGFSMLCGNCAEALALRKAFPAELSGVYSDVEMAQADNAASEAPRTPAPAAPASQTRQADVPRKVAQAAGVPLQTTGPSDTLTTEIRRLWSEARPHIDEAAYAARFPAWRTDAAQAGALRQELQKVLGNRPAPEPQAAPEVPTIAAPPSAVQDTPTAPAPTDVQAEVLLSDSQRKALCGHATRAGAKSSEDRALIWGHLLNTGQPVGTKTLTEAQAHTILGMFSDWGNEEAAAVLAEAKNTILPF